MFPLRLPVPSVEIRLRPKERLRATEGRDLVRRPIRVDGPFRMLAEPLRKSETLLLVILDCYVSSKMGVRVVD